MGFGHAVATGGDWRSLTQTCADRLAATGGAPLGMVYATEALAEHLDLIVDDLTARTGIPSWSGAVGYGVCATGVEYYDGPALAVLACDVPAGGFHLFDSLRQPDDRLSPEVRDWAAAQSARLAVVHADPGNAALLDIVDALAAGPAEGAEAYLVGALTAAGIERGQVAGAVTGGGVSGVLFGDAVEFATGLTQGCSPIGPMHAVSAGEEDVCMELDGKPALEILSRDLGDDFDGDWRRVIGQVHAGLPVAGSDMGDYLVRAIVAIDPRQGWLQIGASVEPGDKLVFVRRDATSALADLEIMLDRLAARLDGPPKAGLYHNCIGRGRAQFGPGSEELRTIQDRLGEFPLVGMFGNGEVAFNRVYSYTGVLTLFV